MLAQIGRNRSRQPQPFADVWIVGDDRRAMRLGLVEDEEEFVVGRIGVGGDRNSPPAALLPAPEGNAVVLQLEIFARPFRR